MDDKKYKALDTGLDVVASGSRQGGTKEEWLTLLQKIRGDAYRAMEDGALRPSRFSDVISRAALIQDDINDRLRD